MADVSKDDNAFEGTTILRNGGNYTRILGGTASQSRKLES